jgi:hypothetical protein
MVQHLAAARLAVLEQTTSFVIEELVRRALLRAAPATKTHLLRVAPRERRVF